MDTQLKKNLGTNIDEEDFKSGYKGVGWCSKRRSWASYWYSRGKVSCEYFCIERYGFEEAKQLAIAYRKKKEKSRLKYQKSKSAVKARPKKKAA